MDRAHLLVQLKIKKWKNGKKMEKWTGGRRSAGDGAGGRSAGDGAGEEIRRRWGKGRIAAGWQGCPEVEAWWLALGRRRQHLLFYFPFLYFY
jgi:hypothetical protein